MLIYVDIDETICSSSKDLDYSKAKPFATRIEKINKLFDKGNTIVYYTARGSKTGINWRETTLKQLESWGCKYHELKMGKPHYDMMICDKCFNSEDYLDE